MITLTDAEMYMYYSLRLFDTVEKEGLINNWGKEFVESVQRKGFLIDRGDYFDISKDKVRVLDVQDNGCGTIDIESDLIELLKPELERYLQTDYLWIHVNFRLREEYLAIDINKSPDDYIILFFSYIDEWGETQNSWNDDFPSDTTSDEIMEILQNESTKLEECFE